MKKKVVLLGDSIRLWGYGTKVPELLSEEYDVVQPEDNCRFTKYTLRGLFDWGELLQGADIIHWNNGLWDATELFGDGTFTTEEEYIRDATRIARILKKITPKVIFATTTPVWDEFEYTHTDKTIRFYIMHSYTLSIKFSELGHLTPCKIISAMNEIWRSSPAFQSKISKAKHFVISHKADKALFIV